MKKLVYMAAAVALFFATSCDHVDNIYPETFNSDLNQSYFTGDWNDYVTNYWPDFDTITASSNRNVLIEDYTGHTCTGCPAAAEFAHANIVEPNPDRVFVAGIHSGPDDISFQALNVGAGYDVNFMNPFGLGFGTYFADDPGFTGNPSGSVNRIPFSESEPSYMYSYFSWSGKANEVMASPLKVAIKGHINYFEDTKGAYLHTEVELLDASLTNELGMIVYLIEDSIVAQQLKDGVAVPDYIHRDIHRTNVSGLQWGRDLSDDLLTDGKYYLNYAFEVPNQLHHEGDAPTHNAENMHVLIYVYDKSTLEIYQVIKEKFK